MFQKNRNEIIAQKLLIIDEGVLDSEVLLADLQPDYKVVRLTPESDPILQITKALLTYAPVGEINILAHAQPGQINFTNHPFNLATLESRESEFHSWRDLLSKDAKICIYACSLASGEIGQEFIHTLGFLTKAEVASSTLPIGNVGTEHNWDLDSFTNTFDVLVPFSRNSIEAYEHTLADPTLTLTGSEVLESASTFTVLTYEVALSEAATTDVLVNYLARSGTADENI